jgi:PD-(D/E)XK nuclease superfamily
MAAGLEHCRLPSPQSLAYTTPSGAATLADCGLRAAYDSDTTFHGSVPSSPAARLGTVCHRVLELAGVGALPPAGDPHWREAFEAAWTEAIAEQEKERQRNPLEAHWPPPARWPYYAARKVATRRLCKRISESTSPPGERDGALLNAPEKLQEQRQQAFDGKLRGRADVTRRSPQSAIEDYKTGSVLDDESAEIKPQYRTQMLLYAVLEHETTGVWPKHATLIPLRGEPIVIDVDPAEANAAAEAALVALEEYNRRVDNDAPAIDLATPTPNACRFCPYAIECPAFWSSADESWLEMGIVAVAGPIHAREESRLSTFNVRIAREKGSVRPGDYLLYQLDAERFGAILSLPEGSEVAALWLIGDPDDRYLRATLRTRIAIEHSTEAPAS